MCGTEIDTEKIKEEISSNLIENATKTFYTSDDASNVRASLRFINSNNHMFDKINPNTLAVHLRNERSLSISVTKFSILTPIDNQSLIELCHCTKDENCLKIILDK